MRSRLKWAIMPSPAAPSRKYPDLTTLEMESKVDETDRGRIAIGDTVLVHVDALPGAGACTAKLVSITPLTEQSFNEWPPTRSFRAFAQIDHPDPAHAPGNERGRGCGGVENSGRDQHSRESAFHA